MSFLLIYEHRLHDMLSGELHDVALSFQVVEQDALGHIAKWACRLGENDTPSSTCPLECEFNHNTNSTFKISQSFQMNMFKSVIAASTQWHECLNRLSLGTDSFQSAWWRSQPPQESSSKSSAKKTSEV